MGAITVIHSDPPEKQVFQRGGEQRKKGKAALKWARQRPLRNLLVRRSDRELSPGREAAGCRKGSWREGDNVKSRG